MLGNHKIVERDKTTKTYSLPGYESLSADQKRQLIELCQSRLESFVEARGKAIYDHRRVSVGYISGTLKYEVLKAQCFVANCAEYLPMRKLLSPITFCPVITAEQTTSAIFRHCVTAAMQ